MVIYKSVSENLFIAFEQKIPDRSC